MTDGPNDTVIETAPEADAAEQPADLDSAATAGAEAATEQVAADVTGEDPEADAAGEPVATEPSAADAGAAEDEDSEDESEDGESDNPLDIEGEVAADYLEELLDIADLDGDIDTYVENGRAHVSVLTESEVLVGSDGEVLDALQELTRLAVITETGNRSRLMLDVGGFRERRRQELTELAKDAIEDVKSSGEPARLAPMNPFERKIVHDVVADAGLNSESEGEEPQRRVVITPSA